MQGADKLDPESCIDVHTVYVMRLFVDCGERAEEDAALASMRVGWLWWHCRLGW